MRSDAPALLPILRSRHLAEILTVILLHPDVEYTLSVLAATLDLPLSTVQREVNRLSSAQLIRERRVGRSRLVSAGLSSRYARPLAELVTAVGVLAEIRRDEIGERDDPAAGLRFGRPERTAAAGKVVDLTSNPDSAGVQVDVVGTKCSEFSPAKAGLGGQEDQRCISRPHGVGQGVDLGDGQDWTFR